MAAAKLGLILVPLNWRLTPAELAFNLNDSGAETLFFDYHRQHNLNIRVVRIFNTYGPRMHPNDGRVVSNFILQALHQRSVPAVMLGGGGYSKDSAKAVVQAISTCVASGPG